MVLVTTKIDEREVEVQRDRWALEVARELGVEIPTLCYHPALEPYGACRLCVVEVTKGKWTWLTTSCDLPIREGLTIRTNTPGVLRARRMALELIWASAPDAVEIQNLARRMGVEKPRFAPRGEGKCILCGLCVRVCRDLIGAAAISFTKRGSQRSIAPPYERSSADCIGCGACAAVCPTGHIQSVEKDSVRHLETWHTELELAHCEACSRPFVPVKLLERIRAQAPALADAPRLCEGCRRSRTAAQTAQALRQETKLRT